MQFQRGGGYYGLLLLLLLLLLGRSGVGGSFGGTLSFGGGRSSEFVKVPIMGTSNMGTL